MDQNDKEMIVLLIKMIMTSKSIQEQQTRAFEYIKSSPDMILALLKMNVNDNNSLQQSTDQARSKSTASQEPTSKGRDNLIRSEQSIGENVEVSIDVKSNTGVDAQIQELKFAQRKRKLKNVCQEIIDKDRSCTLIDHLSEIPLTDKDFDEFNIIFFREMTNVLSISERHKQAVLTILQASENLRKLFLNGKEKIENEMIPAFKEQIKSQVVVSHTLNGTNDNLQSTSEMSSSLSKSDIYVPISNSCQEAITRASDKTAYDHEGIAAGGTEEKLYNTPTSSELSFLDGEELHQSATNMTSRFSSLPSPDLNEIFTTFSKYDSLEEAQFQEICKDLYHSQ